MRTETQSLMKLPKLLNFVLGIVLISTTLVFMFTEQQFKEYEHIEPILVLLTGFLSLMVAFSSERKTGFRVNLILGSFYVLIGLTLAISLFYKWEWFLTAVFGFKVADVLLNLFLGIVLLVLAYSYKGNSIIEEFEP